MRLGQRIGLSCRHGPEEAAPTPPKLPVSPDECISAVKHLASEKLNVPVSQQCLLFKGKALADEHRLSDYSIGPESKLNLVIKPPEKTSPEEAGRRCVSPRQLLFGKYWLKFWVGITVLLMRRCGESAGAAAEGLRAEPVVAELR
uniref:Uncharacterized protein n=1 Tax=Sphaerodactylus townsendi TaxID=933632 RepID=A0ACB8G1C5_9SAUR